MKKDQKMHDGKKGGYSAHGAMKGKKSAKYHGAMKKGSHKSY